MSGKRKAVSGILVTLLLMSFLTPLFNIQLGKAESEEDHGTVYDYKIVSATQSGKDEITVKLQVRYCPYCNPNDASNQGCTEFAHGYPTPYYPYNYWCGGLADGRYVAVRIKDSTGAIIGTQKLVCNPTNWPLNVILTRDFVFSGIQLVVGSVIIAEADVYCSWCGHWYPSPVSLKIAPLKVCIDVGHDEISKPLEYAINKGVVDKLKSKLETNGIVVYLTNPSDDIPARASYANNLNLDIFVSLHCNALEGFENGIPVGTVNGSEVWIYDDTDSIEQATKEHDLAVRTIKGLTKEIESKLREGDYAIWKEKEDPWPNGILILRSVIVCPAVLLEMEFYDYGQQVTYKGVTYQNMLELMNTTVWREDAAQGIANGILGYFKEKGLTITAKSAVDIVVTDPDGLIISKQLNEIPSATYSEIDLDGDGDLDDQIRIPDRKLGEYTITVIPEPDALPTDTYALEVSLFGEFTIIAENILISDIPAQPYIIISTTTDIIPSIILSTIDFDPDTFNLKSEGKWVTVYIELSEGYDVSQIDVSSIMLNSTVPALTKPTEVGDYDADGAPDLMIKFDRAMVIMLFSGKIIPEYYAMKVTGEVSSVSFKGADTILVISPP